MAIEGDTISTSDIRVVGSNPLVETFTLNGAEVDMMSVQLVGWVTYIIDVDGGNDSYLRVFDTFGNEVYAQDDGGAPGDPAGTAPFADFYASYTGTYYIAFSLFPLTDYDPFIGVDPGAIINPPPPLASTVSVDSEGFPFFSIVGSIRALATDVRWDHSDMLSDADGRVRIEHTGFNTVENGGEVAMARYDLRKGDRFVIDVNGTLNSNTSFDLDSVLRVFGETGTELAFDDGAGGQEDAELVFDAPYTGAFFVGISGQGNGTYDALAGSGTVNVFGGQFNVIIHLNPTILGTSGAQVLDGTDGDDYAVLLAGDDTSAGGAGKDTLAGGDGGDSLRGGIGQDYLYGEANEDRLFGDKDSDILLGGLGEDSLYGGRGEDHLEGEGDRDTLEGGDGNDTLNGGAERDEMYGGRGNDRLNGQSDNDRMFGGEGNDQLFGDFAKDTLDGGAGNDTLQGGQISDVLIGGAGTDVLTGGTDDDDVFVFASLDGSIDTITDFQSAVEDEVIDLSGIFAATGAVVTAGNLGQFIQVSPGAGGVGTQLAVDADGALNGQSFTVIAQVNTATQGQLFAFDNFIV